MFWNSLTASKNCDQKYKEITDSKFVRKIDKRYFNLKNEKNKNIIKALYTKEIFFHYSEQYCKYK